MFENIEESTMNNKKIYTLEITKVTELGEQKIPETKREFIWKSEEHKTSMLGEPPEQDPLELYGRWEESRCESRVVPNSYTIEAVCEDANYGDRVILPTLDSMFYTGKKFVTFYKFIIGEPKYKVGDLVKCFLTANLLREE